MEERQMPMTSRPHEVEGNSVGGGRQFRTLDFRRGRNNRNGNGNGGGGKYAHQNGHQNGNGHQKSAPPEVTNAENFYYLKQMNSKTPMVIMLTDGEEVRGWIEWYDRNCLKVNREGAPNLLIQKHCIKYLFKQEELTL
jgi:sRNA-binding regulator protein Hfq